VNPLIGNPINLALWRAGTGGGTDAIVLETPFGYDQFCGPEHEEK